MKYLKQENTRMTLVEQRIWPKKRRYNKVYVKMVKN